MTLSGMFLNEYTYAHRITESSDILLHSLNEGVWTENNDDPIVGLLKQYNLWVPYQQIVDDLNAGLILPPVPMPVVPGDYWNYM